MHSGNLPILVGVTGHRDLRSEDLSRLSDVVGGVLDGISARFPHSPLALLTALAEGSDRLVAREALRRGWSIIVPLPMPQKIYEAQFESSESREEFRSLLERAAFHFELPWIGRDIANKLASESGADEPRIQYEALGVFLVRHAQILIALWDGHATDERGGTSHVVSLNLWGTSNASNNRTSRPSIHELDPWDRGPLHHVMTPRRSDGKTRGVPFEATTLYPEGLEADDEASARFDSILTRIDRFNRQIDEGGETLRKEATAASGALLPTDVTSRLDHRDRDILCRFGYADALATRMQARHRLSLGVLFGLVLLALTSFEAYDNLLPEVGQADPLSLFVLSAYPLALATAYLVHAIFRRSHFQDRHLDYRAFAEGLRVQLFWNMADLNREVSDHYLRKQSSELRWIHEAIRVSNVAPTPLSERTCGGPETQSPRRLVYRHWVQAQLGYYLNAARRDAKNVIRTSRLATGFYAGSIATTLIVLAIDGVSRFQFGTDYLADLRPILFMSIALMLGLSALIRAYSEKMGHSEQALQYQRMRALFSRAERALRRCFEHNDYADVERVFLDLGEEALQENADWVLFRRSRGIEIPQG